VITDAPLDRTLVPPALQAVDHDALAAEFGTPLFVYDEDELRRRCREYRGQLGDGAVIYAAKAFLCTAMARLVAEEGLHLDVATGGELYVARAAGFPLDRIVFHGNNKSDAELRAALEFMQPGDTLVVPALDRLSRSLQDLITTVADLRRRGVGFTSLHEALDTTNPGGRLVFHVFAALAEFIRELIVAGTREGLAAARERGRTGGRPVVATPEIIAAARDLLPNPAHSITSIARLLGVSPGTLYNHIPDLRELRQARAARPALPAGIRPVHSVAACDDLLPVPAQRPGSKS